MSISWSTISYSPTALYSSQVACSQTGSSIAIVTSSGLSISTNSSSFTSTNFSGSNMIPLYISEDGNVIYSINYNTQQIDYSNDGGTTVNSTSQLIDPSQSGNSINIFVNSTGQYMVVSNNLLNILGDGKTYTSSTGPAGLTLTDIPITDTNIGVSCSSTGKYVAAIQQNEITSNSEIYYSTDGSNFGIVYSISVITPLSNLVGNKTTGQHVFCSILYGGILYSNDYGATWTLSDAPTGEWLYISCSETGQYVYCIPLNGSIYYSNNYGQNWSSSNSPSLNWRGIFSDLSGNNVLAYDTGNNSYSSSDYGLNWELVPSLTSSIYQYYVPGVTYDSFIVPPTAAASQLLLGLGIQPPPPVICFKEGSTLLSFIHGKEQYVPIENIRTGTLVKTLLNGYVPVHSIGTSKIYNSGDKLRGKNRLYRLTKEKYSELTEDLIITGCHSLLVEELSEKQRSDIIDELGHLMITDDKYRLMAIYDERADTYEEKGLFNIWHLALEHDDERMNYGVYANGGLLVETTSQRMLANFSGMTLM
jgi:hypothetical protein